MLISTHAPNGSTFTPRSYRTRLIIISLITAIITGLVASFFLFKNSQSDSRVLSAQNIPSPPPLPENQRDLETITLLLLGYGGPGHEGGFLTDAILLVHVNFQSQKIGIITIPRDLWVTFPDGPSRKINAAFAHGGNIPSASKNNLGQDTTTSGSSTVKSTVAAITGLPVNYFVSVDFVGLQRAIGQVLEGIQVEVTEPLDDPWYPIEGNQLETCGKTAEEVGELTQQYSGFQLQKQFPCRYEHLHFDSGLIHMEGGDALKFVRSRHSGSDFVRSQRQIAVLIGIKNKLLKLNALDQAGEILNSLLYTIQTDLDVSVVSFLAPALKNATDFALIPIHLNTTNVLQESKSSGGAFILLPQAGKNNWSEIQSLILSQL